MRYTHLDVDFAGAAVNFIAPYLAPGVLNRSLSWSREHVNHLALDNRAEMRVMTGPVEHTVLAGLSYEHAVANLVGSLRRGAAARYACARLRAAVCGAAGRAADAADA